MLTLYGLVTSTLHISKPLYCPESQQTVILHNVHTKTEKATLLVTQFVLWRERCSRIFRETSKETQELIYEMLQELRYQASVTKETSWEFLTYVACFNFKSVSFLLLFFIFSQLKFHELFFKILPVRYKQLVTTSINIIKQGLNPCFSSKNLS